MKNLLAATSAIWEPLSIKRTSYCRSFARGAYCAPLSFSQTMAILLRRVATVRLWPTTPEGVHGGTRGQSCGEAHAAPCCLGGSVHHDLGLLRPWLP